MTYKSLTDDRLPGRLPALLEHFDTLTCRLFETHGVERVGFWTVNDETNSDLVYRVNWSSEAESEARWASFRADPEGIEARA